MLAETRKRAHRRESLSPVSEAHGASLPHLSHLALFQDCCTSAGLGQVWREAKRWNVLCVVSFDVFTSESTLPPGKPLSEAPSGMCRYWGVSYSELLLSLLEKAKPRRRPVERQLLRDHQPLGLSSPFPRQLESLVPSTPPSTVQGRLRWFYWAPGLRKQLCILCQREEDRRKDNFAIQVPGPQSHAPMQPRLRSSWPLPSLPLVLSVGGTAQ